MTVFANKLEVSCKAQANKVIAAFPDVCMTPPENPATPPGVPIPYPNFGFDTDSTKGTSTVKIGSKTVNQKNVSFFAKTTGDEAGCAAKKGVITSKITGKSYSQAFSMNVKAEGKNLTRFSDISTNNHGSPIANTPPFPKIAEPYFKDGKDPCEDNFQKVKDDCPDKPLQEVCDDAGLKKVGDNTAKSSDAKLVFKEGSVDINSGTGGAGTSNVNKLRMKHYAKAQADACLKARRCVLFSKKDADAGQCCSMQTGHHMIPESSFSTTSHGKGPKFKDCGDYVPGDAPCVCVEGCCHTKGSHGLMHGEYYIGFMGIDKGPDGTGPGKPRDMKLSMAKGRGKSGKLHTVTYPEAVELAKDALLKIFKGSNCSGPCVEAQIKQYHDNVGIKEDTNLRCDANPGRALDDAKRRSGRIDDILGAAGKL